MAFTDIRFDLIEKLPPHIRPYALLMRLDRPAGWWLLLLPGWWGIALGTGGVRSMHGWDIYMLILFLIGAVIMRGAGCIVNDLWDRDLDAQVERTRARPLASGAVQLWQAVIFLAALCSIGLCILLLTSSAVTIWTGFLSIGLIAAYPYMKRITWWPQAFLGVTFNLGALMGWGAVTGTLSWPAALLYVGGIFWTLGYDTIYAHQDKADDEIAGIKSTARLFGDQSKFWVAGFYTVTWLCLMIAAFLAGASIVSLGLLVLPGLHLALQLLIWKMDDQESSLRVFKSNRVCGLLFFLGFLCA